MSLPRDPLEGLIPLPPTLPHFGMCTSQEISWLIHSMNASVHMANVVFIENWVHCFLMRVFFAYNWFIINRFCFLLWQLTLYHFSGNYFFHIIMQINHVILARFLVQWRILLHVLHVHGFAVNNTLEYWLFWCFSKR